VFHSEESITISVVVRFGLEKGSDKQTNPSISFGINLHCHSHEGGDRTQLDSKYTVEPAVHDL
jgi:hypothetical protein